MKNNTGIAVMLFVISAFLVLSRQAAHSQNHVSPPPDFINQQKINIIRDRAVAEVDGRIAQYSMLLARITNMNGLPAGQKSAAAARITSTLNDLKSLKDKVKNDTTPQSITSDKQQINRSYRDFLFYTPQIRMLSFANSAKELSRDMMKNTSKPDVQTKLKDVQTKADGVITELSVLTPDGYPGNKQSLLTARSQIKIILQDLLDAHKALQ